MLGEQDENSKHSGISSMLTNNSSPTRTTSIDMVKMIDANAMSEILTNENAQSGFDVINTTVNDNKKNLITRYPLRPRINGSSSTIDSKGLLESPVSRKRSTFLHAGLSDFQSKDRGIIQRNNDRCLPKKLRLDRHRSMHSEEHIQEERKSSMELEKRSEAASDADFSSLDETVQMDDAVFKLSEYESSYGPKNSMHSVDKHSVASATFARANSCSVFEIHSDRSPQLPPDLEVQYCLPAVKDPQMPSKAFRSISAATLANEVRRLGDQFSEKYALLDCRYPYEYKGGHIKTAINIFDQGEIEKMFFPRESHKIPIFYCEFSQKRGPGMASKLRSIDRTRNELSYPNVDYQEMYILDRGYRNLWLDGSFGDVCEPQAYTPMDKKEHRAELKAYRWHKSRSSQAIGRIGLNRETLRASRRGLFVSDRAEVTLGSRSTGPASSTPCSMVLTPDMDVDNLRHAVSIPALLDLDSSLERLD